MGRRFHRYAGRVRVEPFRQSGVVDDKTVRGRKGYSGTPNDGVGFGMGSPEFILPDLEEKAGEVRELLREAAKVVDKKYRSVNRGFT